MALYIYIYHYIYTENTVFLISGHYLSPRFILKMQFQRLDLFPYLGTGEPNLSGLLKLSILIHIQK